MGLSSLSWLVLAGSVCHSIGIAFIILAGVAFVIGMVFMINLFCDSFDKDKEKILRRGGIIAWGLPLSPHLCRVRRPFIW